MDSIFVVIIGLGIAVGSFLLAGPCPLFKIEKLELWMLLVCLSILGLTNSLIYVPAQDLTFNISNLELPENVDRTLVRGFLSSCWVTFYSFGFGIGMVFSGSVAQYTGWAWTMTSYAGGCVLFIVIVSIVKVREILLLGVCKPKYETLNSS
ncbi:hypothetical protein EB796_006749 [Bugula neritina]|nr:hypothetical protein EB796_006749 [Bugula neritina]